MCNQLLLLTLELVSESWCPSPSVGQAGAQEECPGVVPGARAGHLGGMKLTRGLWRRAEPRPETSVRRVGLKTTSLPQSGRCQIWETSCHNVTAAPSVVACSQPGVSEIPALPHSTQGRVALQQAGPSPLLRVLLTATWALAPLWESAERCGSLGQRPLRSGL